jgi:hypothetical protein
MGVWARTASPNLGDVDDGSAWRDRLRTSRRERAAARAATVTRLRIVCNSKPETGGVPCHADANLGTDGL